MAHVYSEVIQNEYSWIKIFYSLWKMGKTDMFMLKRLNAKKKFDLYNNGHHFRDFTYIEDVNEIIIKLINKKLRGYDVFNICSNKSVKITTVINFINKYVDKSLVKMNKLGLQKADVIKTHGNNNKIKKLLNLKKFTPIEIGLKSMIHWYKIENKL